jgi:hypothetical protein
MKASAIARYPRSKTTAAPNSERGVERGRNVSSNLTAHLRLEATFPDASMDYKARRGKGASS